MVCLFIAFLLPVSDQPPPGGGYALVTEADVLALKLNHYFTADRKGRAKDFDWSFSADGRFSIKNGTGPIPADLLEKLLPAGGERDVIEEKWKFDGKDRGTRTLVLTDIKGDGKPGRTEARLTIYRTAPTVVRIGEPQYVFALER
jgi:hypothetical protein